MQTKVKLKRTNHLNHLNKTKKLKPQVIPRIPSKQKLLLCGTEKKVKALKEGLIINKSWEMTYDKTAIGKSKANTEKALIHMFKIPFSPSKITPRNDYYTYINYRWIYEQGKFLKTNKQYFVQQDNFRISQDEVYHEIIELTEDYIKNNNDKRSKLLNNVYKSFLNLDETAAESHVSHIKDFVDDYITNKTLIEFLAEINLSEVVSWGCPIVWGINPDEKNSQVYKTILASGQMSLYDTDLYLDILPNDPAATYKKMVKKEYFSYINNIFNACLGEGHGLFAQDIWDVENDILNAFECNNIKNDSENYNLVNSSEILTKYGFDWNTFAKAVGYKIIPSKILISSLNYLTCIMKKMQENNNWATPKWRTYWLYIYYRQLIRFHKKWREIHYNFNEKILTGQAVMFPKNIYPVFGLAACFNTLISNEFIKKNTRNEYVLYVMNMGLDLAHVFKRIIKRNTWLMPNTKKYALQKINHLKLIVGSPEKLREDPLLDYVDNDPWGNLYQISLWRVKQVTLLDNKPIIDIPVIDWQEFKLVGTQPYIVNAFYTPDQNAIYIPLAYLRKPFIDLDERGIEYNLAHIGFTLCHEMSHSLDDLGSQYDYKGNLKNWWTEHDRNIFNSKVNNVIEQYEEAAARDGIQMDASLSTGENLADISGLAICTEYLRDFQAKNEDIVPIRSLSFEAFFCYYAIQARLKIDKKAVVSQLKSNPHPLDKYRTNCPLARIELFKSIFNIQKGDDMYWRNNDTIW